MLSFIALIVSPLLGFWWFLNLKSFLKNLKNGESPRNQNRLGAALNFVLIFSIMFCIDNLMVYQ